MQTGRDSVGLSFAVWVQMMADENRLRCATAMPATL